MSLAAYRSTFLTAQTTANRQSPAPGSQRKDEETSGTKASLGRKGPPKPHRKGTTKTGPSSSARTAQPTKCTRRNERPVEEAKRTDKIAKHLEHKGRECKRQILSGATRATAQSKAITTTLHTAALVVAQVAGWLGLFLAFGKVRVVLLGLCKAAATAEHQTWFGHGSAASILLQA